MGELSGSVTLRLSGVRGLHTACHSLDQAVVELELGCQFDRLRFPNSEPVWRAVGFLSRHLFSPLMVFWVFGSFAWEYEISTVNSLCAIILSKCFDGFVTSRLDDS